MNVPLNWLLKGPPWVRYRTLVDLMGQRENTAAVQEARHMLIEHLLHADVVSELANWPGYPLKRHNDARHPLHKLTFLADLGVKAEDPGIGQVIDRVLALQSPEGPFEIEMDLHKRFGALEGRHSIWMICDAPLVVYALARFGLGQQPAIKVAADHLVSLVRDNGWPCYSSPKLKDLKGPGKREDPCPFANLVMLKALTALPGGIDEPAVRAGAEALLNHWEHRRERKPFRFGMGSGFAKLKVPFVWFDILHVTEVLSHFPAIRKDPRLQEMMELIKAKADTEGRFTAESIWMPWRDWDFGQKRVPSPWMTLLVHRMLRRMTS